MSELVAMEFPPEMIDRLRAMMGELTALWTSEDIKGHMAAAFAAGAITDKVCSMAALSAADLGDDAVEPQALFAVSLGVGCLLATNWCCQAHAVTKVGAVASMAIKHAETQSRGDELDDDPSDLSATQCKGTA